MNTQLEDVDAVSCPKCGGKMWDNRLTKRNPKAPDYKCRDRNCDGVVWPPRNGSAPPQAQPQSQSQGQSQSRNERRPHSAGPRVPAIDGDSPSTAIDAAKTIYEDLVDWYIEDVYPSLRENDIPVDAGNINQAIATVMIQAAKAS